MEALPWRPSTFERPLNVISIGSGATRAALRPFADVASVAVRGSLELERRALARVLDGPELERLADAAFDSPRVQALFAKALDSAAAKQLVAIFFESSLFDELIVRLLESRQLWLLIEEIVESPTVMAAISRQGLGFADQVGEQVRDRSRRSDDWLERAARRLSRGHATGPRPAGAEQSSGGIP
jgi:hypothetical protein